MNQQTGPETVMRESLARIEAQVQARMNGRMRDFRLSICDGGLVLERLAQTYHVKQLAKHAVMDAVDLPISANEIEVV